MYKSILMLIVAIMLTLTLTACDGRQQANDSIARITYDLTAQLAGDTNELLDLPWFSPFSTAYEALGLEMDELMVIWVDEETVELAFPVYLELFGKTMYMRLRYLIDDSVNEGSGGLFEVSFNGFAADEEEYAAMIDAFAALADREDMPYSLDYGEKNAAVSGRNSVNKLSSTLVYYNDKISRDCSNAMKLSAGDFSRERTAGIGETLDDPIAVQLVLYVSVTHGSILTQ